MSSNVVKCVNCNVVINELLAFVNNKIAVMDDESISKICISAFSEEDIVTAKSLLFDSLPKKKRKIVRKRTGKSLRNIDDIICHLRDADSEDIPVFVARDLEKLPPVLFDHVDVTRLLKDIMKMQQDIKAIKEEYVTMEHLDQLKSEFEIQKCSSVLSSFHQNVNKRRGAARLLDSSERHSGPMGLPPIAKPDNEQHKLIIPEKNYRGIDQNHLSYEGRNCSPQPEVSTQRDQTTTTDNTMTHLKESSDRPPLPIVSANRFDKTARHTNAPRDVDSTIHKTKSVTEIVTEGEWKQQTQSEEWIKVQRKRLRNRFMGNRGKAIIQPGNNFKAADIKIPIYIYNVAKGASVCDINEYIKTKTSIDVSVEKMDMKINKDYESYKIFVPKSKLGVFMSEDFWPEGVAYRRFINFKYRGKGTVPYENVNQRNQL